MCIYNTIILNRDEYRTPLFWECKCEDRYIHPVSKTRCEACNTFARDACPALVREVLDVKYRFRLPYDIVAVVEAAVETLNLDEEFPIQIPF